MTEHVPLSDSFTTGEEVQVDTDTADILQEDGSWKENVPVVTVAFVDEDGDPMDTEDLSLSPEEASKLGLALIKVADETNKAVR